MFSKIEFLTNFVTTMEPITMLFVLAIAGLVVVGLALVVVLTALK